MQSIKRTLSPITFDAHIQDDTRKKVFMPGELVAGVVRIKKDDVVDVKQAWIELVGEQVRLLWIDGMKTDGKCR